ncbi:hypothetical protein EV673_2913 [Limnobacter thiooxidans]|uniref:Uncharacterized protein n=1 Tax=Limnobacter thiooxidans TaxID=131080 RepID=A0AA86J629_9BURK|nr:hypothetical protein EV673_2913 [Limnobacter thiooxidans]BET25020.1 hypothetical protein RGQ30_05210 [Limnobacter thiooxidans]
MQTQITSNAATSSIPLFWINWLSFAAVFTMLFGLLMVVLPGLTLQGFGLMIFKNANQFGTFDPSATAYIELAHAVMGAVLFGWGALIFMVVRKLMSRGIKEAWGMVAGSVLLWYLPDTAFSLVSGFWQNAVLNTGFACLYAVPLFALRPHFK